jgi:hypothetical protein
MVGTGELVVDQGVITTVEGSDPAIRPGNAVRGADVGAVVTDAQLVEW